MIRKNITTADTHTLLAKSDYKGGGVVSKIVIANRHDSNVTNVDLFVTTGSADYGLLKTDIPANVTLVLTSEDIPLSFKSKLYDLKVTTSGSGAPYNLTVTIT